MMFAVFDFAELVAKLKPHILMGKLLVSLFGVLLDFWLPVVVISILWAHARFATKGIQTSVDGDAGLSDGASWASMKYSPEIHGSYFDYLELRRTELGDVDNSGRGRFTRAYYGLRNRFRRSDHRF